MANFAQYKIELTSNPFDGDPGIQFQCTVDGVNYFLLELPRTLRNDTNRFTIGATEYDSAEGLRAALFTDYKPGGAVESLPLAFLLDFTNPIITISATQYGVTFFDTSIPSWASTTIIPEVEPTPELEIGDITASEAYILGPCGNARYDFTLLNSIPSDFPIEILSPVSKICNTDQDLFFDYDRNHVPQATLQIVSDNGPTDSKLLPIVATYTFDSVGVVESFNGATITLNTTKSSADIDISFTYSIDDVNYQASNIFYSVLPGNYTAYVLDDLGCKKSLPFEVVGVTVDKPEPFFKIENVNSIKFYERTVFTPCGERPNFDNSPILDQGYWNIEKRDFEQLAQRCENTPIQIKTTYDTNTLNIYNCKDELVFTQPFNLAVENILQQDKRDCQVKAGADGKTNIYYISGNIYEPGTTTIIGDYTINNGLLPEFASDGNITSGITIQLSSASLNGVFVVEQSVYDEDINGYALQIAATYTGTPGEAAITDATYNEEDYNIYEAAIDWSLLDEGVYKLEAFATDPDPRYNDVYWDSEKICNADYHEESVLIEYSNPDNIEQADYTTGIVFKLRVPARFVKYRNGGESENFVTDDGTKKQLKGQVVREVQLETPYIPQYLVEKISIASIHKNLFINGIKSTLSEIGETEDKLTERNPFYIHNAWYQFGEPIEISDGTGVISSTGRALEVNTDALGITL